jgi:repressor of nif and glnA expression
MSNLPVREQTILNMLRNSDESIAVWIIAAELAQRGDAVTLADCLDAIIALVERGWIQQSSSGEHLYELTPLGKKP